MTKLKYLFSVEYKDGSTYAQNPEDRSITEPEKRSCFFDVALPEVVRFTLRGDGNEYVVDLRDGHFEINGKSFKMHEDEAMTGFELVFFRRHTHHFLAGAVTTQETSHEIVYRMGWQCKFRGKNYKEIMHIK